MNALWVLVGKELRIEARRRELLSGGLVLAFLVLLVGNLAWGRLQARELVAPGVLWVAVVFAAILLIGRSIQSEHDRGTWDALAAMPVDWSSIFFAKTIANLIVLLVVEAAALAAYALLFSQAWGPALAPLALVMGLGSLGLVAAGTLLSAVAAHGRNREILLPVLLIPLLFPLLMMCIQATERLLLGLPVARYASELQLLLAFDAIYLALGWLMFEHVVGD
jgi:heme exporter protein B